MSRGRALSVAKPIAGSGLKDAAQRNAAIKIADRAQRRAGKAARKVRDPPSIMSAGGEWQMTSQWMVHADE